MLLGSIVRANRDTSEEIDIAIAAQSLDHKASLESRVLQKSKIKELSGTARTG